MGNINSCISLKKKVFNISHLTDFKKGREETLSAINDFLYFLFCTNNEKCNLYTQKIAGFKNLILVHFYSPMMLCSVSPFCAVQ